MSDAELIAWIESGAKPALSTDEEAARRYQAFAARFVEALSPASDLGPDEESHERAVAENVAAVHADLNPLGEIEYSHVWTLLSASHRRAIKAYLHLATGAHP
jgi:hypothetical protein